MYAYTIWQNWFDYGNIMINYQYRILEYLEFSSIYSHSTDLLFENRIHYFSKKEYDSKGPANGKLGSVRYFFDQLRLPLSQNIFFM